MKFISTARTTVLVCFVCFVLALGVNAQVTGLGNLADVPGLGEIRE